MDISKVQNYWNTCGEKFAHLTKDDTRIVEDGSPSFKIYETEFLKFIDYQNSLKNKTIIDYGIGNAELPRYLFSKNYLGKYIGIDIAQRSIDYAMKNLQPYLDRCTLLLNPIDFSVLSANVFMSLACIQHFPSIPYLDDFLLKVNKGHYELVILQIRYGEHTKQGPANYNTGHNISLGVYTNSEYVNIKMSNYILKYKSQVYPSKYQYLIYERKK